MRRVISDVQLLGHNDFGRVVAVGVIVEDYEVEISPESSLAFEEGTRRTRWFGRKRF